MIKFNFNMGKRIYILFFLFILSVLPVVFIDYFMGSSSAPYIYEEVDNLPYNKCGLLLGTSKYRMDGQINPYFRNRMAAAVKLFKSGKIDFIIASGDNSEKYYNEPKQMRAELIKRGVPKRMIFLDFAGFRTLDSVVRSKYVFGQTSITVISQKFHIERAIYIGRKNGLNIYGFVAEDVLELSHLKVRFREVLARMKAFMDIYILNKKPKFLGKKVIVE